MTDDPNAQPEEVQAEEAQDLDDAELEAAAERAKLEVDDEEHGAEVDELEDEEAGAAPEVAVGAAGAAGAAGASGATRVESSLRGPRVRGPKPAEHVAFAIDPELRIRDPWSAAFVAATLAVFGVILAYALLFGHGGALTPIATPTPVPTAGPVTPEPSGSPAPTIAPSGSIVPTPSPSPTEPPPTPVR